ncbi:ubiquitin-like-specific protease 1D isoform X2 [Cryptomeria japonica]|uniref:ubiquitin-like-specific protease 1D isoform X2 n=1 Tax=Cryptomeria japonica TaxID=3369 RepID=UPI0025AD7AC8|nr:ubiquitin-like-specific protease 1D isoform X2 [Cryptomeria japonica]
MAGIHLKPGWFEDCKDEVMELHILEKESDKEQRDGDREHDLTSLTDSELDDKIVRLKGLMKCPLPDSGLKLNLLLQKHLDEKKRREDLPKSSIEIVDSVKGERSVNSEKFGSFDLPRSTIEYQRCTPVRRRDAVQQREPKPDDNNKSDKTDNAFEDDLKLLCQGQKKLIGNGLQHSNNREINRIRRSPRKLVSCSPINRISEGDLTNSVTRNKKLGSSGVSVILGESGRILSAGKRAASSLIFQSSSKKHSSLTPKCSVEKIVVDLDEEDEKQKQQHQGHSMSLRRRKKDIRIYYPERNHPESVEIRHSDMECLAPGSYLSSVIMNFYIRYLQCSQSLSIDQMNNYHFFNTFFYSKLEEALDSQVRSETGNSFAKLRRWFKGVNIFEKAYIFLPIHASQHWSLAIISVPAREDEMGPIILHLDSLGLHTSGTIFSNIRSYLKAEWEHLNQEEVPEQVPIAREIWKDLPNKIQEKQIQVPQQQNDYDCGLFVLFFMEHFIKNAPPRLRKTDLDRAESGLNLLELHF